MNNKRALVIGYGNPLRGDDGVGWEVAGRLAACTDDSVEVKVVQQLTPELSEPIHQSTLVIFIDASVEGNPGGWKCEEVRPDHAATSALGHHFEVAGLLAYTHGLFQSCPKAMVVSVAAETFDFHENLSGAVEKTVPCVVGFIREQLAAFNSNPGPTHA